MIRSSAALIGVRIGIGIEGNDMSWLEVRGAVSSEENAGARAVLDRIVTMLTKLGRRGDAVREEEPGYAGLRIDSDSEGNSQTLHQTSATGGDRAGERRPGSGPACE